MRTILISEKQYQLFDGKDGHMCVIRNSEALKDIEELEYILFKTDLHSANYIMVQVYGLFDFESYEAMLESEDFINRNSIYVKEALSEEYKNCEDSLKGIWFTSVGEENVNILVVALMKLLSNSTMWIRTYAKPKKKFFNKIIFPIEQYKKELTTIKNIVQVLKLEQKLDDFIKYVKNRTESEEDNWYHNAKIKKLISMLEDYPVICSMNEFRNSSLVFIDEKTEQLANAAEDKKYEKIVEIVDSFRSVDDYFILGRKKY